MIDITVTKDDLDAIIQEEFPGATGEDYKKVLEDFRNLVWSSLLTPFDGISQRDGLPLPVIYAYTEIKRAINKMNEEKKDSISLPGDVFKTARDYFTNFTGWNSRAANLIILMDKKLKAVNHG